MTIKLIFPVLALTAALCSCGDAAQDAAADTEVSAEIFAMDTEMTLKAYGPHADKAIEAAKAEIERLDKALDRGSNGSEIYTVNSQGSAQVSADTAALTKLALDICSSTDGAFDISIAPVMDLWGFYTKNFHVPASNELHDALALVDYSHISVSETTISVTDGAQLDLGGIAKGYLSSRITEIFDGHGVESGIVSLGGNVQTLGKKPDGSDWRIAIQDPDTDGFAGILSTSGKAVITSGGYQRYFEENGEIYHHIIDPSDGMPAHSGVTSVSIISGNGALADGLSTSLFVMGLENGTEYWREHDGFDVVFITDTHDIYITEGLEGSFKSDYPYIVLRK